MNQEIKEKLAEMSATTKALLCRSERDERLIDTLLMNAYQTGQLDQMEKTIEQFNQAGG